MKRLTLLVSLTLVAVLVVPTYAARPTPTPTTAQTVVSLYSPFSFTGVESQVQNFAVITVPDGKTFVLIEVQARRLLGESSEVLFTLLENAESRFEPVNRLRELLPDRWQPLPKDERGLIIQRQ